ncbi:CHRD domain-containing protein [Aeromicrobium erythreum]|uniref:CHRD domain-containing protein n=1 Tax=Aeromicrobium erythreum TaxID=2041 RepID=UPI000834FD81|nr:CHRD domain-containing protein [Aeromicrobium erythreum]
MTVKRATRWTGAGVLATTATLTLGALGSTASADTPDPVDPPESFTSAFVVDATPQQVVGTDGTVGVGQPGATGRFEFLVNSDEEVICWNITLNNVVTPYQSPAKTATHIHQTGAGVNGPPRIAFPNPTPADDPTATVRTSTGCSEGPFTTGLAPNGTDTGTGFTLAQLEANPAGFSADTHTAGFTAGAVRGQLVFSQELLDAANAVDEEPTPPADDEPAPGEGVADADDERQLPVNGVDTGQGGTAGSPTLLPVAALTLLGLGVAGATVVRRRQGA